MKLKVFGKSKEQNSDLPIEVVARQAVAKLRHRLDTRLSYTKKGGELQRLHLTGEATGQARIVMSAGGRFAQIPIDLHRLPRNITVDDLTDPALLRELTAIVGKPIYARARDGMFMFGIDLRPELSPRHRLPKNVILDLGKRPDGLYMIPLGQTTEGPLWASLLDTYHILLAGPTGSGKSNTLHAFLCSLLAAHGPDTLQLAIVDPKGGVELAAYAGLPHLLFSLAHDVGEAQKLLRQLETEMRRRKALLKGKGVRDWTDYNAQMPDERLPLIVVVIDEFLTLTVQAGGSTLNIPFARDMAGFISQARAFGMRCLLTASLPKSMVMDTAIRSACSMRFVFWPVSKREASLALGEIPEEVKLPARNISGRALVRIDSQFYTVQTYHAPTDVAQAIIARAGAVNGPLLTDQERVLAQYALDELGGVFNLESLYQWMGPKSDPRHHGGISYRRLKRLGQDWELRGWLSSDGDPTTARRITDALRKALGATPEPLTIAERRQQQWLQQQSAESALQGVSHNVHA